MTRARKPLAARCAAAIAATALAGWVWASAPVRSPDGWTPIDDTAVDPGALVPDEAIRDQLGGVDYVPTRDALDPLLGDDPGAALAELAAASEVDPGLRLRALRALSLYPGAATEAALTAMVTALIERKSGVDLLYLDAAMMSLARVGHGSAVHTIRPALDHDSKDVRAAAAAALGATGAKSASTWLYERLAIETDEMVRVALSDAIRALDEN